MFLLKEETSKKKAELTAKEPDRKMQTDLGASPELQKKRCTSSRNSRSFLSPLPSSSQNLKLTLESTEASSVEDFSEISSKAGKKSNSAVKSTQDLKLRLDSQIQPSEEEPEILPPRNSHTQTTQDLKLHLETQSTEDFRLQSENSEELKLILESSTEEPQTASSFITEGKSTVKEQRSFISQVQDGMKMLVSKVLKPSNCQVRKSSPLKEQTKIRKDGTDKNVSLVNSVSHVKQDDFMENDNVWLNTTQNKSKEKAKWASSELTSASVKSTQSCAKNKGKKRKSETLSPVKNMKNAEEAVSLRKRRR